MNDKWRFVLLLVSLTCCFTMASAQSIEDKHEVTGVDSMALAAKSPLASLKVADGSGFGDDDQSNPSTGGDDDDGTFGDNEQQNPDTDGSDGGYDDSEMDNGIPLQDVIPGDANGDGKVTITDAVAVVDYILGNAPADFNAEAADVNNDGNVNITDAVGIVDIILNAGQ